MKVMKFGGTSVGSVNSILSVKRIVEAVDEPVIVVVSALGGITDKLINTSRMAAAGDASYENEFREIVYRHVEMIKASAQASDGVIVLANSDDWLCRKKGKNFHTMKTRKAILENLKGVVDVLEFDDTDNSACDGIKKARAKYPDAHLVFANGGDRGKDNIPEGPAMDGRG